jgi:chromosome segregation ATPase
MVELNNKIAAASNAAAAVRKSMEGKFDKMVVLDSQMQQVQAILSSANFQIAMNADSLKETRMSLEGIQKTTDENFAKINQAQSDLSSNVWMLFGIAMAFTVVVLVVLMNMMKKRMSALETILHQNEEILKKSLSLGLEKQQKELKEELQASESRLLLDTATLKRELTHQVNQQRDSTLSALQTLSSRIETLETPPSANTDSSTIL